MKSVEPITAINIITLDSITQLYRHNNVTGTFKVNIKNQYSCT